jgi:hypothetical protein
VDDRGRADWDAIQERVAKARTEVPRKPARYRERPLEVEALQVCWANWSSICAIADADSMHAGAGPFCAEDCGESAPYLSLLINTPEGPRVAKHGDFLLRIASAELYVCDARTFREAYEEIKEAETP